VSPSAFAAVACTAAAAGLLARSVVTGAGMNRWKAFQEHWRRSAALLRVPLLSLVPRMQLGLIAAALIAAVPTGGRSLLLALLVFLPFVLEQKLQRQRREQLRQRLDGMLMSLSNSLTTTGNLQFALEDVAKGECEPMRGELLQLLHEVRLGRTVESALWALAERTGIPEFGATVSQLTVGRRSGGDLRHILEVTAASLREMRRLEGVVKTRTAEGRGQAVVMGLVPPGLCGGLHFLNPGWLAPMWTEPAGWMLLGLCAVMEIAAILLIRRIMAVDL